jgi:hypothetical protein
MQASVDLKVSMYNFPHSTLGSIYLIVAVEHIVAEHIVAGNIAAGYTPAGHVVTSHIVA